MSMAPQPLQSKKGKGCLIVFVAFIAFIIGGMVYSSRDWRSDESVLKNYKPTAKIAGIAEKITLTDHGKATFYRTNPRLVDGESFRQTCFANGVEALGCATGFKILLLQIDDPKFADHKFSAAAHEMLHIAYRRLGTEEKKNLNALLEKELSRHEDDVHLTEVKKTLEEKQKAKKGKQGFLDELHSKFAVEYKDLLPELEEYYKKYFKDRVKVVTLFQSGGFGSRTRKMDEIRYELDLLAPRLTSMESQLTAYQNAGNQEGFNSLIGQYNSTVAQYNAMVAESQRSYSEVEQFYTYFNPDYKPPENKTQ